jgi:hypothetical protein
MKYDELNEKQLRAVCKELTCDTHELESYLDDGDYLLLTDAEADEKAQEYIKDSLWAFNASFILSECGLDRSGAESLRTMQEKSCEGANDFILSLVEKTCGLADFVSAAISADGRGHFLSFYDGEETEISIPDNDTLYLYRCN